MISHQTNADTSSTIPGGQIPVETNDPARISGEVFLPTEIVLTVEEAAQRLKIGRTRMFRLVADGAIESVLIGRLRRIPVKAIHRYVEGLMSNHSSQIAA